MDNNNVFQAWLRKQLGFDADADKTAQILEIVGRPSGWPHASYSDAIHYWQGQYSNAEIAQKLVKLLVNNESYFFREPFCYCFFNSEMIKHCSSSGVPFSVLSVGCSAGQEIYSCAIQAHKSFGEKFDEKVSLYGVDVDRAVLEKARKGVFSDWDMRGLSPAELKSHFHFSKGESVLSEQLRKRVSFVYQNIFSQWSQELPSHFDFVFCRNLLVHFAPPARRDCLRRLREIVRPGGSLVLAAAEIASLDVDGFTQMEHEGFFYLQRTSGRISSPSGSSASDVPATSSPHQSAVIPSRSQKRTTPLFTPRTEVLPQNKPPATASGRGLRESATAYRKALAAMKEQVSEDRLVASLPNPPLIPSKANKEEQVFERNLQSCFERYSTGEIQEALQYCDLCLKQTSAVSPEAEGSFLVIKGLSHKALGNTKAAFEAFERSAFLLPLSWTANFFLGESQVTDENNAEAARSFVRAYKCLICENVPLIDILFLEDLPKENMKSVCLSRLESLDCRHLIDDDS